MFVRPSSVSGLSRTALFSSLISKTTFSDADRRQEIQEILGVEPDLQVLALVLDGQAVAGLADLRVRGEQPHAGSSRW